MLVVALACVAPSAAATAASPRFSGKVTDTLRTPTHRFVAPFHGEALADLVFADATHAKTTVRTCVKRRDVAHVHTCFHLVTGAAGTATVTPLRFPRGRYEVHWSVGHAVVARWRFTVVEQPVE